MFSIPVHELIKRPGAMKQLVLQFDLDAELGTGYASVPKGESLKLDLRLESVHEGILVTGDVTTKAHTECSRCLEDMNIVIHEDFQELFVYSNPGEDEVAVSGDAVDLEQVIIDSVVLNLPFKPVCSESCLGLCAECGLKLVENPDHVHEAPVDSRFADLKKLLGE